jgi:hypothetical protein
MMEILFKLKLTRSMGTCLAAWQSSALSKKKSRIRDSFKIKAYAHLRCLSGGVAV